MYYVVLTNPQAAFREKFPHPILMLTYTQEQYKRITALSNRWYTLHILPFLVFYTVFTLAVMEAFYLLNNEIYSLLSSTTKYYPQMMAPFAVPALIIAFAPGILAAVASIRLFHTADDFARITDMMNVKFRYNEHAAWKWMILPTALMSLIAYCIVGWCYVSVSPNGFNIKNAFSFTEKKCTYSNIAAIKHYDYQVIDNKETPYDHYAMYFTNGVNFYKVAPYIDLRSCLEQVVQQSHIPVDSEHVDKN